VIGFRLDELTPKHNISVYTEGESRILASSEKGQTHTAVQISCYARQKGLAGRWNDKLVGIKSVRVKLGMDGQDRTYTLDRKPDDPAGVRTAKVLEDLGVDKKQIRFNPKEFHQLAIWQ
jgi:hypothetical protein